MHIFLNNKNNNFTVILHNDNILASKPLSRYCTRECLVKPYIKPMNPMNILYYKHNAYVHIIIYNTHLRYNLKFNLYFKIIIFLFYLCDMYGKLSIHAIYYFETLQ